MPAVEAACRDHIDSFLGYIATGQLPAITAGSPLGEPPSERIRQGIRLDAYLHAFRVGHDVFWEDMLAAAAEDSRTALEFARPSMRYIDSVSTKMAELYLRAEQHLSNEDERASRDLLEALLTRTPLDEPQARRVAMCGIDGRSLVAVLRGPLNSFEANEASLRHTIESALHLLGLVGLVVPRRGDLVAVLGLRDHPPGDVAAALRSSLAPGARCGIGPEAANTAALPRAHEHALAALRRTQPDRPLMALSDAGAYDALLIAGGALAQECTPPALMAAIDSSTPQGSRLAETARTWLASDQSVQQTCDRLFIHPNTLRYRLRQLEERAGLDLRRFADLVELRIALDLAECRAKDGQGGSAATQDRT
jgi:hypothetical protein